MTETKILKLQSNDKVFIDWFATFDGLSFEGDSDRIFDKWLNGQLFDRMYKKRIIVDSGYMFGSCPAIFENFNEKISNER